MEFAAVILLTFMWNVFPSDLESYQFAFSVQTMLFRDIGDVNVFNAFSTNVKGVAREL